MPVREALRLNLVMTATLPVAHAAAALLAGLPQPSLFAYIEVTIPGGVAALGALVPSAILQRLGRDVDKARRLGSYRLEERIGRGGMGEVWRASHRMLVRPAAIKLIRPERLAGDDQDVGAALVRFHREAQATAALRSPHTVQLYDFGVTEDNTLYYAMELLDGFSLADLVSRFGPVPPSRAIYLLRQLAASLAEAHASRLLHRDIKPSNVLTCRMGLEYDFVKVLDFGLAKPLDEAHEGSPELTSPALALGTPAFMAPEMILAGKAPDQRADLYGFGCVAYWLLTGQLVFTGQTAVEIALAHTRDAPVPPSTRIGRPLPEPLESLVLSCLAKAPADRPETGEVIIDALDACPLAEPWTSADAREWWRVNGIAPDGREEDVDVTMTSPSELIVEGWADTTPGADTIRTRRVVGED
jgi:serine/threonine-protein kinase